MLSSTQAIAKTGFALFAIEPEPDRVILDLGDIHAEISRDDFRRSPQIWAGPAITVVVKDGPFRRNTDHAASADREREPLTKSSSTGVPLDSLANDIEEFAGGRPAIKHLYCQRVLTPFSRQSVQIAPAPRRAASLSLAEWFGAAREALVAFLAPAPEDTELKTYLEATLQAALDWGKAVALPRQIDLSIYPDKITPVYVSLRYTAGGLLTRIVIEDYNCTPERVKYIDVARGEDAVGELVDYMLRHYAFAFDSARMYFFYEAQVEQQMVLKSLQWQLARPWRRDVRTSGSYDCHHRWWRRCRHCLWCYQ